MKNFYFFLFTFRFICNDIVLEYGVFSTDRSETGSGNSE